MPDKSTPSLLRTSLLVGISLIGCTAHPQKDAIPTTKSSSEITYATSTPRHWDIPYKAFPTINQEMPVEGNEVPLLEIAERQAKEPKASAKTKFYYGLALYRAGQYNGAVTVLRALMPRNPRQRDLYKWTGYALIGTGDLQEAAKMFGHFATMNGVPQTDRCVAFEEQGNCYWKMGRLDDAATAYKKDIALDPQSVVSLMQLVDIALRQGNHEQAKQYFDQLSRLPIRTPKNWRILSQLRHRLDTGT